MAMTRVYVQRHDQFCKIGPYKRNSGVPEPPCHFLDPYLYHTAKMFIGNIGKESLPRDVQRKLASALHTNDAYHISVEIVTDIRKKKTPSRGFGYVRFTSRYGPMWSFKPWGARGSTASIEQQLKASRRARGLLLAFMALSVQPEELWLGELKECAENCFYALWDDDETLAEANE